MDHSFFKKGSVRGVSIKVGHIEFTLIPFGASSTAKDLVKPSNANFVEQ